MLSRELKDMEANQLIKRTVTPTSPVSWNIHLRIIAVPLARSFLNDHLGKNHRKADYQKFQGWQQARQLRVY